MSRLWKNYINQQKYSECQVISAINAYYYFTGRTIKQNSPEYEGLVDQASARHGSAIRIKKIHDQLGLIVLKGSMNLFDLGNSRGRLSLPIEATVWHKRTGYHSVLIVDQCLKTGCIRVANFQQVTSTGGWMFKEDFYQYERNICKDWKFRLLGMR